MDIKQTPTASPKLERCTYLGLREDPQTALAFPSVWNFCHKVQPARTVALAYQRDICQLAAHRQCPIVEAERVRALPLEARGRNPYGMNLGRGIWITLSILVLLAIAIWLLWIFNPVRKQVSIVPGFLRFSPAALDTPTKEMASSPSAAVTLTDTPGLPSPAPSSTEPSSLESVSPVDMVCGYQLDQPIHAGYQLVLHRAKGGENLNKYASDFDTTVDAILAANYQLPVPLRIDWVLVIPIGITNIGEMPPFEPYFEASHGLTLDEVAQTLSMNASDLRESNSFADGCQSVAGWLLVPRAALP